MFSCFFFSFFFIAGEPIEVISFFQAAKVCDPPSLPLEVASGQVDSSLFFFCGRAYKMTDSVSPLVRGGIGSPPSPY